MNIYNDIITVSLQGNIQKKIIKINSVLKRLKYLPQMVKIL